MRTNRPPGPIRTTSRISAAIARRTVFSEQQSSPHPDVERAISVLIGLLARQAAREAVHIQDPQQGSNDRDP